MRKKSRSRYTPEQIAEWRAEEKATADHVDAQLSDPAAVAAMIATAVRIPCGRFLRYSLRNQALILRQAEQRGFTVTDIDTATGWRARGRYPAQPALKISAPKGREADADTDGQDAAGPVLLEIVEGGETAEEGEGRTRFRMRKVWDISQTAGIEDFDGEPATVEPVADPAAVLWETLCGEAARYGFTVTADPTATAPQVDQDRAVITVEPAHQVQQLAQVLGPMSADRSRAVRDPAPREYAGTAVDLGEFGTAYLTEHTDLETARSYYTITGKRLSGTVTVWIAEATATEPICRLRVAYGEDDGRRERRWFERPNPPQVNGIAIVGSSSRIHVGTVAQLGRWEANARRPISDTHTDPCPPRTTERFIAVLRAILGQYLARPDLEQIHQAAIVVADRNRRSAARAAAAKVAADIEREREASAARIATLQVDRAVLLAEAADGEDDPTTAAAPQ
ncbi:hypothetical protein [Nocardia sp. NPDC004722]